MDTKEQAIFESTRDAYFLNPKNPGSAELAKAAGNLIQMMLDPSDQPEADSAVGEPLHSIVKSIADDYQKHARSFNHLSVAQLHPAGNQVALLAQLASIVFNNNTIIEEVSPLETEYEEVGIRWLISNIAGYNPRQASGSIVSGGTSANLTALKAAREKLRTAVNWDQNNPPLVFASSMSHYSIAKAAGLLEADLVKIPLEPGKYTMSVDTLSDKVTEAQTIGRHVLAIVATAGETETGQVDRLADIAAVADKHDVFLHVDGAYGGPFRLSRASALLDGLDESDSLTCDPHKYLYANYPCGSIMFADRYVHQLLSGLNEYGDAYMFQQNSDYLGKKRLEGSMGGQSAAQLYRTVNELGRVGIASLLNHTLDLAAVFADAVISRDAGLQLSFAPSLNTVCVEPGDDNPGLPHGLDEQVETVANILDQERGIYLSTTSLPNIDGDARRKVFRFVATNPHTDEDDAKYIAEELAKTWEVQIG
ncbi:aspartate aminotransferase family protein [Candidatus Microgenomates bacterium]|nr:aspartate aminotransferase family protein [Candidatus Microgenomates bacterium]